MAFLVPVSAKLTNGQQHHVQISSKSDSTCTKQRLKFTDIAKQSIPYIVLIFTKLIIVQ